MVYGHYVRTTDGKIIWFPEGCAYCHMSTSGQHEINCPCYQPTSTYGICPDIIADRDRSHNKLGLTWEYLAGR